MAVGIKLHVWSDSAKCNDEGNADALVSGNHPITNMFQPTPWLQGDTRRKRLPDSTPLPTGRRVELALADASFRLSVGADHCFSHPRERSIFSSWTQVFHVGYRINKIGIHAQHPNRG